MNIQTLLEQTPRLRAWANIGPVQLAELEQFAHGLLNSQIAAITSDGVGVTPGDEVWVLSSLNSPMPCTVKPLEAYTTYTLFGPVQVARSFSTRQAALDYLEYRYGSN